MQNLYCSRVKKFDYLVIGGGSGGIASARRAARYGVKVGLIEASALGGTCVNRGCVPKKVMWNAAQMGDHAALAADYGFQITNSGLQFDQLKKARDAYIERLNGIYEKNLRNDNVEIIRGYAVFTGEKQVQVGDEVYTADHILIAVGGRPFIPEIEGAELGMTSDGFFELEELPERVAIVGAGYIAVEIAGIFNALGVEVDLLLRNEAFLRQFDDILRDTLMNRMSEAGVNIISCIHLNRITRDTEGNLELHGSTGEHLTGINKLIWATGRLPNTSKLQLDKAGVKTGETGRILTDSYQNTSVSGIYSVGDVSGPIELTPVAIAAGRQLSERLFNDHTHAKMDYENVPTVIFSHPPIGTVGMSENEARTEFGEHSVRTYSSHFTNMLYALSEHKPKTAMKIVTAGESEKIVGVHIIGDAADEIIQGFAVAVRMGARMSDLDRTVAIHPTAAEELVTMR